MKPVISDHPYFHWWPQVHFNGLFRQTLNWTGKGTGTKKNSLYDIILNLSHCTRNGKRTRINGLPSHFAPSWFPRKEISVCPVHCQCEHLTGWPRHREIREFGSYFSQTWKTQGIWFWHREKFANTGGNIWTVIINIKSMFIFLNFKNF